MGRIKVNASDLVPVTSILNHYGYSKNDYKTLPLSYVYWLIRRFYLETGRAMVT